MSGEGYQRLDHIVAMLGAAIKCDAQEFTLLSREIKAVHEALTTPAQGLDAATIELLAEALWQADSERSHGRKRRTAWADEGDRQTRDGYRFNARKALEALNTASTTTRGEKNDG